MLQYIILEYTINNENKYSDINYKTCIFELILDILLDERSIFMFKDELIKQMEHAQKELNVLLKKYNYNMLEAEILSKSKEIDTIHNKIITIDLVAFN